MATKGRPKSTRRDGVAKIDLETLRRAKILAGYEGKTLAEFLTELIDPLIEKRFKEIAAEMVKKPK